MTTNLLTETVPPSAATNEPRGLIPLLAGAVLFAVRKYLKRKAAGKAGLLTRADFLTEMLDIRERLHADHLALLEKLGANHRELLAALERQVTRINTLESGLARVDERTKSRPSTLDPQPSPLSALFGA